MHSSTARRPLDKELLNCKDKQAQRSLYQYRIAADHKRSELALKRAMKEPLE